MTQSRTTRRAIYGRLGSTTDQQGTETYAYDDRDAITQKVVTYAGLPGKTIGKAYHADGSIQTVSTPAGSFGFAYDGAGRMVSQTNPFGETTGYTYLNNDWLAAQTLANGAGVSFTHNAVGQLTAQVNTLGAATLSQFTGMTYDGVGNRTNVTSGVTGQAALSGATTYTYDAKNQLTQEASARAGGYTNNFVYDSSGNPTTFKGQSRTHNAKNQLTNTGFGYDSDGNPTTYNGLAATFNVNDCLTALGTQLTAGYTGEGLRAWKQNNAGTRTYFLYDNGVPVCELDGAGAVVSTNTFGPNGLVSRRTGGSSAFYTFDERGGTVQRLNSAGTVLSSRMTDAFGTPGGSASTGDPYDGFGGQWGYYTDAETGLQLCTYRYYDPATGRWINRDPIGYAGGVNLYTYCNNNPVLSNDSSGLASWVTKPDDLGLTYYGHAWIKMNKPCGPNKTKSFGFWPNSQSGMWPGGGERGEIHSPDLDGETYVHDRIDNPEFEAALCACIVADMGATLPGGGGNFSKEYTWRVPLYMCGSWAKDMWDCASRKLLKEKGYGYFLEKGNNVRLVSPWPFRTISY
ncbi:MAG: RHS repeat-associated core domain-containing protein [Fibrella sp.]|nr:RHS repeat-associated core domain-containing protein [Armatimonadota bacterium]